MKVLLADKCGFCFGVRRAIDLAQTQLETGKKTYSLGPLIHNPQVIDRLTRDGLSVINSPEEAESGVVIVRSHGAPASVIREIENRGLELVDATCPLVKRAQQRAQELARDGYTVVVVGEADHPEVRAILADIAEAVVIEDDVPEDLGDVERLGVIAQTTQMPESFARVVSRILELNFNELRVYNTICSATTDRQQAALEIAHKADVMFVLGGRNSANTCRLAQLCETVGVPTYHLETVDELRLEMTRGKQCAGVTAGASTPDWIVSDFVKALGAL